jgi:hypothetical protein
MSEGGVIICWTKCWPCNFGQHPGGEHTWADADDIEHAQNTGQPDPSSQSCGCWCVKEAPTTEDGPPELDFVPLVDEPCPVCDSTTACGWDAEGRPLIHAVPAYDEESA